MKKDDAAPLALHERVENALRIAALDRGAARLGLYQGQPLAEARALFPDLSLAALDRDADAADFRKLLAGLMRYSPLVGSGGFGAAFIDIAGSSHLFGGEARLGADAVARLRRIGLKARAAIAGTPGCAFALAAFSSGGVDVIPKGGEAAALASLPVAALRIDEKTAEALKSLGLKTIGMLMTRRRKELARRFGEAPCARLDAATGALFEPIAPIAPSTDFSASAVLAEPVMSVEAALAVAERLARALGGRLERAGLGARAFAFSLYRLDMSFERVPVVLGAPSRDAGAILRLLRLKLEKGERPVDPGFGFESFRLCAFGTAPLLARQLGADGARGGTGEFECRLANHLGAEVFRLAPVESHIPERAEMKLGALAAPRAFPAQSPPRPLALIDPPEPIAATAPLPDGPPAAFRWRRQSYRVARAAGPERILGEWTKGEDFLRDYYRVEDEAGRRYWIFREGLYETGAKWFLHGFFA